MSPQSQRSFHAPKTNLFSRVRAHSAERVLLTEPGDKWVTIRNRLGWSGVVASLRKPEEKPGQRRSAAPGCLLSASFQAGGRRFESCRARQYFPLVVNAGELRRDGAGTKSGAHGRTRQLLRADLHNPDAVGLKLVDPKLRAEFGRRFPTVVLTPSKGKARGYRSTNNVLV